MSLVKLEVIPVGPQRLYWTHRFCPPFLDLKLMVLEIYNNKLSKRLERRKFVFDRGFLEYKKVIACPDGSIEARSKKKNMLLISLLGMHRTN